MQFTPDHRRGDGGFARYPAIDGLRGIAILSIVVYHTGLYANGLFGVDAFLVLSGFFVTLTLGRGLLARGTLGLRAFYGRRIKRLLPPLLLVLSLTAAAVLYAGTSAERSQFVVRGLSALGNLANWQAIYQGDAYWNSMGRPGPLSHMWSLSLTEQFYVLWPPVLALIVFLTRKARVTGRRAALVVGGVVSFAIFVELAVWCAMVFAADGADRAYMGTDTHGMALAAGAVAGLVVVWLEVRRPTGTKRVSRLSGMLLTIVGTVALASVIVLSICADSYQADWLYFGGFAAVAILIAAAAVILVRPSPLARALSGRPLVAVGRMSYSLFLIHMPIIWFIRALAPTESSLVVVAVAVPVSLLLATILHHAFSEPLRLRRWNKPGRVVAVTTSVVVALVITAVTVLPSGGAGSIRVLTLGDSLANDFATALSGPDSGTSDLRVIDGGLGGCGIMSPQATRVKGGKSLDVPNGCLPWELKYAQQLAEHKPQVVVIDLAWDGVQQQLGGAWTDLTQPGTQQHYRQQLEKLAGIFARSGAHVLIADSRSSTNVTDVGSAAIHSRMITQFVNSHPGFSLLDLNARMCPGGVCSTVTASGVPRYLDGVHFTRAGIAEIAPWLADRVLAHAAIGGTSE